MPREGLRSRAEALRVRRMEVSAARQIVRYDAQGELTDSLKAAEWSVEPVWWPGKVAMGWRVCRRGQPATVPYRERVEALHACQLLIFGVRLPTPVHKEGEK